MDEFLGNVFKYCPATGVHVRWGPLQPALFVTIDEVLTGIVRPTASDLFFSPAVRRTPQPEKSEVLGSSTAWCDLDEPGQVPLLPPNIIVLSGGPGHFHYYWLLDKFISSEELEVVNKALLSHVHVKSGGTWNSGTILRVPGSINSKYTPPKQVRILHADFSVRYNPSDLALLKEYDPKLLDIPKGKTRSERDHAVVKLLSGWQLSREARHIALDTISDKAQEEGDHYVTLTLDAGEKSAEKQKDTKQKANFLLEPVARLKGANGGDEGLVLKVKWSDADGDQEKTFASVQRDFESPRSIDAWLARNGIASRIWLGSAKDAVHTWALMVENVPDRSMLLVRSAGRHDLQDGHRVFVYGREQALVYPNSKLEVFWQPHTDLDLPITLQESSLDLMDDLITTTVNTNLPEVLTPALGWVLATPFKPLIEQAGMKFPIMLAFGQKGSGKTTMVGNVLLPLLGISPTSLNADITPFAMAAALSSTNAIPLWIDEFRASNQHSAELQAMLRAAYDGQQIQRGRQDLTVTSYRLTSPVVVDGESVFPDSALRERTLAIKCTQKTILNNTPHNLAYQHLRRDLHTQVQPSFADAYLRWSLTKDMVDVSTWLAQGETFFRDRLPYSRLSHTATVAWMGIVALNEFYLEKSGALCPAKFEQEDIYSAMCNVFRPKLGVLTPVETLVEIVAYSFRKGQQWARDACEYDEAEGVLWFSLTAAHHWVRHWVKEMPDKDLLMNQVDERIGVYLRPPVRREGGLLYGLDIKLAQDLGMDVPDPPKQQSRPKHEPGNFIINL